jgi:hypothetical protein
MTPNRRLLLVECTLPGGGDVAAIFSSEAQR